MLLQIIGIPPLLANLSICRVMPLRSQLTALYVLPVPVSVVPLVESIALTSPMFNVPVYRYVRELMLFVVVRNRTALLFPSLQARCNRHRMARFPSTILVVRLKSTVLGNVIRPVLGNMRTLSQVFNGLSLQVMWLLIPKWAILSFIVLITFVFLEFRFDGKVGSGQSLSWQHALTKPRLTVPPVMCIRRGLGLVGRQLIHLSILGLLRVWTRTCPVTRSSYLLLPRSRSLDLPVRLLLIVVRLCVTPRHVFTRVGFCLYGVLCSPV